ncbi:iron-sulfur cluster carrier protein ApbC [Neisseria sp. Ec49-e6-T10]|uniref:iron-sulfur cluster carrier protein ApbC n=1 Tax=Neisseria sp. Ec49-e6-T10 TaxID=3140744 RepID=UPI003EBC28AE
MMNIEELKKQIGSLINPDTTHTLAADKVLINLTQDKQLNVELIFPYPVQKHQLRLQEEFTQGIEKLVTDLEIQVSVQQKIVAHQVQQGVSTLKGVKNIIAVASGKGGVGKSTTTANLAYALNQLGAKVGVLDADIYGPSQPMMMGVLDKEPEQKEHVFVPVRNKEGIQVMSIGFLVEDNQAMVWRGPMVSQALQQLIFQSEWDDLDYLIVDLPPGTGDVQLTLAQKIPVTGALVVTTPQDIALIDAKKAIDMFGKVNIPIMGILENMSTHICSQCGHVEAIFGQGGGDKLAEENHVPLLGQLPLSLPVREAMDDGQLAKLHQQETKIAQIYEEVALKLAVSVAQKSKDFSSKIPKIVVE